MSSSRAACAPTPRSQPGREVLTEALRGVLAETATTGCIRYDWQLLKPLCHSLIDTVLAEYAAEEQVEVSGWSLRDVQLPCAPACGTRACSAGRQQWRQPELRAFLEAYSEEAYRVTKLDMQATSLPCVHPTAPSAPARYQALPCVFRFSSPGGRWARPAPWPTAARWTAS